MAQKEKVKKHHIVVIGNGMVGHSFCKELRNRDSENYYQITVFGDEKYPAYDRVNLSTYFKTKDENSLSLGSRDWYQSENITLETGMRVRFVHTDKKFIETDAGDLLPYDSLILATGSVPFRPHIPGIQESGVFVYRTIEDLKQIESYAKDKKIGAVIGGGLLGLEAAKAIQDMGLEAHVIQNAYGLMNRQLFKEGADVLANQIRRDGVHVYLEKYTESILRNEDESLSVCFRGSDKPLVADLVIVSAGIVPRDDIEFSKELRKGARGGYIVNDFLQTSDPSIYAIGECALHKGQIYGLVAPGYAMSRVLAERFVGGDSKFEGADLSCRLKVLGIEVASCGDYLGNGDVITYSKGDIYRMILLEFGRVIGCSAVGPWNAFTSVQQAIADEKKMTQSMIHSFLETGEVEFYQDEGGVASWPATAIICNCTKANKGNISDAIVKGALDLDMLGKETGAGTVCGSCQPLLKELLGFRETNPDAVERPKKSKRLLVSSFLAILLVLSIFFIPGIEPGNSVQTFQYKLTKIWTDSLWKQVTGYSLLTLSLFALLLSVRKRLKFFNVLNFGSWRRIHSILGLATLLVLLFHTGLHLGDNLNLWLMICFLGLNLLGAFSAITVAMENHWTSARSRMYRHYLTRLHIIFFWPYPVLLGYHIFKAYYY